MVSLTGKDGLRLSREGEEEDQMGGMEYSGCPGKKRTRNRWGAWSTQPVQGRRRRGPDGGHGVLSLLGEEEEEDQMGGMEYSACPGKKRTRKVRYSSEPDREEQGEASPHLLAPLLALAFSSSPESLRGKPFTFTP